MGRKGRGECMGRVVIDRWNPQTLYFGTFRLWRSVDSGGKWAAASPDLTGNRGTIKTIAVAPSDSNTIYVGTSNGKVQVTIDAQHGTPIWTDRSAGLPARTVTKIAIDPVNPATAYVAFSWFPTAPSAQGY